MICQRWIDYWWCYVISASWPQPSNGFTSRIINGQAATATQAPFICSMRFTPQTTPNHLCGASILNRNWVLSAAHCVTDIPAIGTLDVQCGITHRINDVINQQIRPFHRVNDVRNHPGWIANAVGPDDITVVCIWIVKNTKILEISLSSLLRSTSIFHLCSTLLCSQSSCQRLEWCPLVIAVYSVGVPSTTASSTPPFLTICKPPKRIC